MLNNHKNDDLKNIQNLNELKEKLLLLQNIPLKETANKTVLGYGNVNADILLIGEAPGQEEDKQGLPFVGRSGKLLDEAFSKVALNRDNIFITNTVFWRPENNRNPTYKEIDLCYPFVQKIIEIVNPKIIVLVGKIAGTKFYDGNLPMYSIRGKWFYHDINSSQGDDGKLYQKEVDDFNCMGSSEKLVTTIFHPSYVLRGKTTRFPVFLEDIYNIISLAKKLNLRY